IWSGNLYSFGTPLDITQAVQNPLANTTLKYKQNVTVATLIGAVTAITQDYHIRLWGKVYKNGELPRFGQMGFPAYLTERTRNRTVLLTKAAIPINADTWLTLPGGKDQAIPKVNPFARYAYNLLATDAMQGDYQFRLSTGGVAEEQENMYWEFDELDALFIKGLGVKLVPTVAMPVPANLAANRIDSATISWAGMARSASFSFSEKIMTKRLSWKAFMACLILENISLSTYSSHHILSSLKTESTSSPTSLNSISQKAFR
ncbi:unnamed protein product, partial [marine sediment metagenome]